MDLEIQEVGKLLSKVMKKTLSTSKDIYRDSMKEIEKKSPVSLNFLSFLEVHLTTVDLKTQV